MWRIIVTSEAKAVEPMISAALWAVVFSLVCAGPAVGEKKSQQEEGEYRIYFSGRQIGTERYAISASGESVSSNSILDFRNPGETNQKVHLESKLEMDANYVPKSYELRSDVDGKKGAIRGIFSPNQVMFEYVSSGSPNKQGLLVGKEYTLLDTNLFHQFAFLARRFKYGSREKLQRFEVVIPQESDSGILKMSETGQETIQVQGKKVATRHLLADSGSILIHLWVDDRRVVQKISVPTRGIEVVRN